MLSAPGRRPSANLLGRAGLLGLVLAATPARADAPADARQAYARGAASYDRGDFAAAAVDFARADELAPNAVTLEIALKAALKADAPALGMELVERSKRAPVQGTLAQAVGAAKDRFAKRAAQVVVRCAIACQLTLDGAPVAAGAPRWVAAGDHTLHVEATSADETRVLHVPAGQLVEVSTAAPSPSATPPVAPALPPAPPPAAPPPPGATPAAVPLTPPPAPPPGAGGISPAWFGVLAGATAVAGAITIGFGVDTLNQHAAFASNPTADGASGGQSAELRTNVMIGVTSGLGVAAAAVGIFAVRWPRSSGRDATVGLSGTGLYAAARF